MGAYRTSLVALLSLMLVGMTHVEGRRGTSHIHKPRPIMDLMNEMDTKKVLSNPEEVGFVRDIQLAARIYLTARDQLYGVQFVTPAKDNKCMLGDGCVPNSKVVQFLSGKFIPGYEAANSMKLIGAGHMFNTQDYDNLALHKEFQRYVITRPSRAVPTEVRRLLNGNEAWPGDNEPRTEYYTPIKRYAARRGGIMAGECKKIANTNKCLHDASYKERDIAPLTQDRMQLGALVKGKEEDTHYAQPEQQPYVQQYDPRSNPQAQAQGQTQGYASQGEVYTPSDPNQGYAMPYSSPMEQMPSAEQWAIQRTGYVGGDMGQTQAAKASEDDEEVYTMIKFGAIIMFTAVPLYFLTQMLPQRQYDAGFVYADSMPTSFH